MKKKVLILGAGIYQVPLILKAKELGYETIVASIPGNYPGFEFADKIVYENVADPEKILEVARTEKVDGVCTAGSDISVISIGRVCDALGLRGVSMEAAKIACDKMLMKQCYMEHGVRTAEFKYIDLSEKLEEVKKKCIELTYPVIFKAIDSSGSRGITRVDGPEGIEHAIDSIRKVTKHSYYIVEKFLIGEEFGAQAFVQDGKVEMMMTHGDYVFKGDTGVPIGHFVPYDVPELEDEIQEELQKAITAMGVDNCAINADFILVDRKPYVLEIGARAGATCLAELVTLYFGYDYYEKILRVAMGEKVDFSPANEKRQPAGCYLLMSDKTGVIKAEIDHNPPSEDIYQIHFDHPVGEKVSAFRIGPDRIGDVVIKAPDLDAVKKRLHEVLANVEIIVE